MRMVEARRIWDKAPHNAFTDLARFRNRWYCAFREGEGHASDDGKLRVIASDDGREWASVALMAWEGGDVRDAKISVTGDGQLMLSGAVRFLNPKDENRHQSLTWLSPDGVSWGEPYACKSGLGTWRWSATWHGGAAYSFGYSGKDKGGRLYRSRDGKTWEAIKADAFPDAESYPNETSLVFTEDDTAYCLLRRDRGSRTGMLGFSPPPYTDWEWQELGLRIGGPKMIRLRDGRFLAAVRLYEGEAHTSLCWVDVASGAMTEDLRLPSGGDNSYAGMVEYEDLVWVSYYSSHEGKTSLYLAKVKTAE